MSSINESFLSDLFLKNGIELTKRQVCQFLDYYNLLIEWNEKINLTAITDFEDVCLKHFLDSASLINAFSSYDEMAKFFSNKSLADIGTGAGFPGIPLKILIPDLSVTLMDSLDKRIKFLNIVIDKLKLNGICAVHGRVEDLAVDNKYREQFDFSTARAVASLPVLCEYCIPFVKTGGFFISYKSEKANEEISLSKNAIDILGGKFNRNISFDLYSTDNKREIIFIEKISSTPDKYPRKAGKPVKKPL